MVPSDSQRTPDATLLQAIQAAPDPIVVTSASLDVPGPAFVYVNAAFEALTGYSGDDVLGRTPRLLQGSETDRATLSRLRACLQSKRPFHGQTANYRKDGTPYTLEWRIGPVPNPDGTTAAWVSVQHDVTERKSAEREALRAAAMHITQLHIALDGLRAATNEVDEPGEDLLEALRTAERVARPGEAASLPGGLFITLELLTTGVEEAFGFPCTFDFDRFVSIDDPARVCALAAVAREAILDAARHAPHAVHLALSSLQDPITLSVLVRGAVPDDGPARLPALVRLASRAALGLCLEPAEAGGYRLVCSLLPQPPFAARLP